MPNKNYERGRYAEYKTMEYLRKAGFECLRTAGSHGPFDVVAWDDYNIHFIQVKRDCQPTSKEIKKLKSMLFPKSRNITKEVWVWTTRESEPEVSVIR